MYFVILVTWLQFCDMISVKCVHSTEVISQPAQSTLQIKWHKSAFDQLNEPVQHIQEILIYKLCKYYAAFAPPCTSQRKWNCHLSHLNDCFGGSYYILFLSVLAFL